MSRAQDIFDRLRARKFKALDELIADQEPESLFLDFKRSADNGVGKNLHDDDNKNLSKSISGFANSSGGVVLWGADCRRDAVTGAEVVTKYPLTDAKAFETKLQAAISRATIPPHPEVEAVSFSERAKGNAGFVALLVPQSYVGPIRSVKSKHYHVRTGSDFGIVDHDVLAGMFGRAPRPKIDIKFIPPQPRLDSTKTWLDLTFGLVAVNLGAIVCDRPYLSASFGAFPQEHLKVKSRDQASFVVRRSILPTFSVVASPGVLLAPGATEYLCDVVLQIPTAHVYQVKFECIVGCTGSVPEKFSLYASQEEVSKAVELALAGAPLPQDILKIAGNS